MKTNKKTKKARSNKTVTVKAKRTKKASAQHRPDSKKKKGSSALKALKVSTPIKKKDEKKVKAHKADGMVAATRTQKTPYDKEGNFTQLESTLKKFVPVSDEVAADVIKVGIHEASGWFGVCITTETADHTDRWFEFFEVKRTRDMFVEALIGAMKHARKRAFIDGPKK